MTGAPEAFEAAAKVGARGARASRGPRKRHKDKPKIGRGQYIKAPKLVDKLTSPRWQANALINNPGHVAAGTGIAGGSAALTHEKFKKRDTEREKKAAAGAAVGAGAGHFGRVGADYGTKKLAERQIKPILKPGARNYGPYKAGPHAQTMNRYKRTVKGDVKTKAKMFDQNFPKGVPSHNARKVGLMLNKKPVIAATILGTAAAGAGAASHKKVKKSMTVSAFGVDHGY